jgi:NMD protein affecting ribosome stability and mRNA decay
MPELGKCERCDNKATDRHHIDGNPTNNVRENIMGVCRRCHMDLDGRLTRLGTEIRVRPTPPRPCVECGKLYKPTRRGMCNTCYLRAWRAGRFKT